MKEKKKGKQKKTKSKNGLVTLRKNMFISGVDNVRFRRLITPGDQLHINIRLKAKKLTLYKFEGTIKIDGQLVVQAIITSNLVDRVEV